MDYSGAGAMFRTEVYRWIRDIKDEKIDLEPISSPGLTPDGGLSEVIRRMIEEVPVLDAQDCALPGHPNFNCVSLFPKCSWVELLSSPVDSI
jgi:hypothetical protein